MLLHNLIHPCLHIPSEQKYCFRSVCACLRVVPHSRCRFSSRFSFENPVLNTRVYNIIVIVIRLKTLCQRGKLSLSICLPVKSSFLRNILFIFFTSHSITRFPRMRRSSCRGTHNDIIERVNIFRRTVIFRCFSTRFERVFFKNFFSYAHRLKAHVKGTLDNNRLV